MRLIKDFRLDARRLFFRRFSGNKVNLFFENFLQPLIVALVVSLAFLSRADSEPFRNGFLYFSTLYAFWIGLFGSCQSINSELKSGEWGYWVLGFRRNRYTHILAILSTNLFFAICQTMCYLAALVLLGIIDSVLGGQMLKHLIEMFVSDSSMLASPVFQMGSTLHPILAAKFGVWCGPMLMALAILIYSHFLAILSGCGFGIFFSTLFKDPPVSLNVSVGFIVLLGMLSLCGLQSTRGGSSKDKVDNAFLPNIEQVAVQSIQTNSIMPTSKVSYMIQIGKLLPQRYFFNAGRILFNHNLSDEANGALIKNWIPRDDSESPPWLRLGKGDVYRFPESFKWRQGLHYWIGEDAEKMDDDQDTYLRRYLKEVPSALRIWRLDIWFRLLWKALLMETIPVLWIFLCCFLGAICCVTIKRSSYEELR